MKTGKLNRWLLLAVVVLLLAAVAAAALVIALREEPASVISYTEVSGAAGRVRFAERTTTEAEYAPLRAACDDCRDAAGQSDVLTDNSAVVVSEETFVDTTEPEEAPLPETDVFVESEAVYFEGLVLVRYVSQRGEHLTCAACYDENGFPMVLNLDGLALEELFAAPLQTDDGTEGVVDEAAFLSDIKGCVMALLFGDAGSDAVNSCFTESGAAALHRVGQVTGGAKSSGAEILLCAVGSTSSTEMLADRICLRCVLSVEGEPVVLDLLLKLNSDLLVYDVDLM